jgi:protoporphyrinogen/coproporphyrinogen III oxidase
VSVHRVVVIGGGISGLAAAHRLTELDKTLQVILLEASARLGGTLLTDERDGFLLERGPDSFISEKPEAMALARRLGLESRLIETNSEYRRSFIVRHGRLRPVPEGFQLLAPSRIWPFVTSDIFSLSGKARMAADLFLPRRHTNGVADESLASFVRRRLGREALERMAQPMVGGIYTADPETLSLRATLPRFLDMERDHGSVVLAMLRKARANKKADQSGTSAVSRPSGASGPGGTSAVSRPSGASGPGGTSAVSRPSGASDPGGTSGVSRPSGASGPDGTSGVSGARYGLFLSFDRGMEVLARALEETLRQAVPQVELYLNTQVQSLLRNAASWTIQLSSGDTIEADAICLALPAYVSAQLLTNINPTLAAQLNQIKYASTATINLAYRRDAIKHPLDGFGFVVPFVEKRSLIACTFSNVKFPGRAPEDHVLLRAFAGGALQPEMFALEEPEMLARVERDLSELLKIGSKPLFAEVSKWQNSMPQYEVGHLDRIAALENSVGELPGLALAGNAYRGTGIPDCIRSGETAAEYLSQLLRDVT